MNNTQMIQQVQLHIENLRQEKNRIEQEITAAQNYLNVLQGNSSNAQSSEVRKGNQTDEARERMKKAQAAYNITKQRHTWVNRAQSIMEIIR